MTTPTATVTILGAGAWGTTLAILLSRNRHAVRLWGHDAGHIRDMDRRRCNDRYLPDIPLPGSLRVTADLEEAIAGSRELLIAVPSTGFRPLLERLRHGTSPGTRVAWATKGLETSTGRLLHEVVAEVLGNLETAVISGPTFAREVAKDLPTAVTVASATPAYAAHLAALLHTARFRAYTCGDMVGVQLGGAVKNVLAIAAGIGDGLGFGANTRAALVTRGLVEMARLGLAMGGQRETFSGLAGLGDLVLTCTDNQSRNRRFGLYLGQGMTVSEAAAKVGQLIEGMPTTREVIRAAHSRGIEMPISEQVHRVLFDGCTPLDAVNELFNRELKSEGP